LNDLNIQVDLHKNLRQKGFFHCADYPK